MQELIELKEDEISNDESLKKEFDRIKKLVQNSYDKMANQVSTSTS